MKKGEQTKGRIVAKAAALLNQHGFEGLSYSDLMKSTGLRKGGIYRHFASKEDLAAAAFEYAWQIAIEQRLDNLDSFENSVDRLKQFVANFVKSRPPVPGGCPLMNTAIDSDNGNPRLRDSARHALQSWLAYLTKEIRRGQRRGEIHDEAPAQSIANVLVSALEGALMISRLQNDPKALTDAKAHLWSFLDTLLNVA